MAPQFIYVMKGLRKVVPPSRIILDDIWLSFYPGAKIGVLGANGAGKSSLLKIMAGIDHEFQGEAWAHKGTRIGYLSQEPQLDPSLDVRGNVEIAVNPDRARKLRESRVPKDSDVCTMCGEFCSMKGVSQYLKKEVKSKK